MTLLRIDKHPLFVKGILLGLPSVTKRADASLLFCDNSGHWVVGFNGFVVICVGILLRWYNIALDFTSGGFIGRLYVIDYLYKVLIYATENSRVKLIEKVKVN